MVTKNCYASIEGRAKGAGTDLYDPEVARWSSVDVVLAGCHPSFTVAHDAMLVPDWARPIVSSLAGWRGRGDPSPPAGVSATGVGLAAFPTSTSPKPHLVHARGHGGE